MGIGKESIHVITTLAQQQRQIYPDACDQGIWETPSNRLLILGALNEFKGLEGGIAKTWHNGSSYFTRIGFEQENGITSGVEIIVSRHYCKSAKHYFYSIELKNANWPSGQPIACR